jgi:hypothetical protein
LHHPPTILLRADGSFSGVSDDDRLRRVYQ